MEINGNINTANVLLMILAACGFILWIIWVIRLAICKHKVKTRNKFLLKRMEEIQLEKRKVSSYEDLIDSNKELQLDEEEEYTKQQRSFRKLENMVRQSRIYRNQTINKDELAEMVRLERKDFDVMFKEVSPVEQISDWMDGFRLNEALSLLREMKADDKIKKSKPKDEAIQPSTLEPEKEKEAKIAEIATRVGFSGRKHLNKACKKNIGMSLHELLRIL